MWTQCYKGALIGYSGHKNLRSNLSGRESRSTPKLLTSTGSFGQRHLEPRVPYAKNSSIALMGATAAGEGPASKNNLFAGAMPKGIGALEFLKKHPEYDGRGTIIAILDTGVDPGAKGLQETPDGKPKILDILDCTGSGDVETSLIVRADEEGVIMGHFDTPLKVNPDWQNPSGDWHVGFKRAFDLFPKGLQKRIAGERKKRMQEQQRAYVTEAVDLRTSVKAAYGQKGPITEAEKRSLDEGEERVALLKDLEATEDPGPMLHCVVWNDGSQWLCAIDTSDMYAVDSGQGKLADFQPLNDFSTDRKYATFSSEDACNYGVHFYQEGKVLSIVVESGTHGTHVAGIATAYHPDDSSLNGIAPGAQIISCKIGDSRLEGMETNVGLTRALIDVIRYKADLINLSYGESTSTPNQGRFIELANEVVNKHGVIFVSSAGNSGPALSSVGAPGGTTSSIVSVGAYVSPELATAGHSIRQGLPEGQQYNWSSRGPTPDGHLGVSLSAPGGAIAPVPNWSQQSRQLMNGTSMASPCACGGFALILSGLKALGQSHTPARVRRAVENTCLPVKADQSDAPITYGQGLLQVHKAFELLSKAAEVNTPDARYEVRVKCSDRSTHSRGIYLREPLEASRATSHTVEVTPKLREKADIKEECLEVEDKVLLQSNADWVDCPELLLLPHNGRTFEIKVDPQRLQPGLHTAEVVGIDSASEWRGPLFRVPITVIRVEDAPVASTSGNGGQFSASWSLECSAGQEHRRFLAAPEGSTWAEMRIRAKNFDTPKVYMIRGSQLQPQTRFSDTEFRQSASLSPGAEWSANFDVIGGATLEVTVAQFWSSLGSSSLDVDVLFHGVQCCPEAVLLDGAAGITRVSVVAPLRREKMEPTAKLTKVQIPLRPQSSNIRAALPGRDSLPENRTIHRLDLSYELKVEEAGSYKPTLPTLNKYVYDNVVEAEMYMVYNSNKRLMSVGDIYPAEVKLEKDTYTIKLLIRHDSAALLEKLRDLPMVVQHKLKDSITLPIYPSMADALNETNAVKDFVLSRGERRALFIGPMSAEEKLSKDIVPGRLVTGKLQLGKTSENAVAKKAPGSIPISFLMAPKKAKLEPKVLDAPPAEKNGDKEDTAELEKALVDAKIAYLEGKGTQPSAHDCELAKKLAEELSAAKDPKLFKVLTWELKRAETGKEKADGSNDSTEQVMKAAQATLDAVDEKEVACFVALKNPEEGPEARSRKQDMEAQKAALIAARKSLAQVLIDRDLKKASEEEKLSDEVEQAFQQLRKWVDTSSADYVVIHAKHAAARHETALGLRSLLNVLTKGDKSETKEIITLFISLLDQLGWHHWKRAYQTLLQDRFPPDYRLF